MHIQIFESILCYFEKNDKIMYFQLMLTYDFKKPFRSNKCILFTKATVLITQSKHKLNKYINII